MTASLLGQYGQGFRLESEYMGDTQPLGGGNVFVGWGSEPYISEFGPDGKVLWEAELPGPDLSYRATVAQWVGEPLTRPAGAAQRTGAGTTVYASWNGATKLASWRVLTGSGTVLAHAPRSGFETTIPVNGSDSRLQVQALDANGRVLGTSAAFSPQS